MNYSNIDLLFRLLSGYSIQIPSNILYDISFNLNNNKFLHKHISFLINSKNNEIINYGFNNYLNSNKFPFSLHSEVNVINKYYKKKLTKNLIKTKKYLVIVKLSKIGIIGNSKPCKHCANFIYNNFDNIKLSKILYSTQQKTLEELSKVDLTDVSTFKIAAGFRKHKY
jgi:tRNA(Arg) A34 adenosine deaminase TadA